MASLKFCSQSLGITYGILGDPQKKKGLLEQALPIFEKHHGPDHFEVAKLMVNLGIVYGALGNHEKQKELLERALPILKKHYGSDRPEVDKPLAEPDNV